MKRGKNRAPLEQERLLGDEDHGDAERVPKKADALSIAHDPASLMAMAIRHGGPEAAEVIERLTNLQNQQNDRSDRLEAFAAFARFKRECPEIRKGTVAQITGSRGTFSYSYAELEQIEADIQEKERECRLNHSWDAALPSPGILATACIIRHENGQEVARSSFPCPTSSGAGMSDQQKFASAQMFGRRKSLEQAYGLVTRDVPAGVAADFDPTPVSEEQAANLASLCEEVGGDKAKFLAIYGVKEWTDLPAQQLPAAMGVLEQRRKK